MSPDELLQKWLFWHYAVEYIKQDLPKVEAADLRFSFFPGWILRQIGSKAYAKEHEAAKELKANGIRIVKEKFDKGELFVVWSHRGCTDIYRASERILRSEAQKRVNEVVHELIEEKNAKPPPT